MNGRKQVVIVLLQAGADATLHNARSMTHSFLPRLSLSSILFITFFLGYSLITGFSCSALRLHIDIIEWLEERHGSKIQWLKRAPAHRLDQMAVKRLLLMLF